MRKRNDGPWTLPSRPSFSPSPMKPAVAKLLVCLNTYILKNIQFSSVSQLCPTLWDPMDCSMPGLPDHHLDRVSWSLLKLMCPLNQWCHPTISSSVVPFSSHLQYFPASGSFQMSQLFTSGGQSIGVLASTSVLSMNIQDWFPLGWTGWIFLFKGLSRVYSNTTV